MIDLIPTTRSRATSPVRLKEIFVGTYFEMSEPPRVRLPKLPLDPIGRQQGSPMSKDLSKASYDSELLPYKPSSNLESGFGRAKQTENFAEAG